MCFVRLLQDNSAEILDTVSCKNVLEVVVRVASIMDKSFEKVVINFAPDHSFINL